MSTIKEEPSHSNFRQQEGQVRNFISPYSRHTHRDMLDDIDLPGDPYFLKCYRSFHNHELDTGMIVMSDLVEDKDIHRKGPPKVLP